MNPEWKDPASGRHTGSMGREGCRTLLQDTVDSICHVGIVLS